MMCVFIKIASSSLMTTHKIPFSNEYTQNTIFHLEKENHPKLFCSYEIFSKGLMNEFEIAVVNKASVFESLKVYCSLNKIAEDGKCVVYVFLCWIMCAA